MDEGDQNYMKAPYISWVISTIRAHEQLWSVENISWFLSRFNMCSQKPGWEAESQKTEKWRNYIVGAQMSQKYGQSYHQSFLLESAKYQQSWKGLVIISGRM